MSPSRIALIMQEARYILEIVSYAQLRVLNANPLESGHQFATNVNKASFSTMEYANRNKNDTTTIIDHHILIMPVLNFINALIVLTIRQKPRQEEPP